jgi:hypothetical protein
LPASWATPEDVRTGADIAAEKEEDEEDEDEWTFK